MTFFSGTDTSTLHSEGLEQNHFVSLIVNNEGTYTAAITRKVKGTRKIVIDGEDTLSYKSFNNIEKVIEARPYHKEDTQEIERLEYYMLDIEVQHVAYERNELDIRLDELDKSNKSYANRKFSNPITSSSNYFNTPPKQLELFNDISLTDKRVEEMLESGNIDYEHIHIEKYIIDSHLKQIITCNLFAGTNPNIDLKQWGKNLPNVVAKRFRSEDPEITMYRYGYAIDSLIDILVDELEESKLNEYGDDFCNAIWANDLLTYIGEILADSPFRKVINKSLERWII